MREFFHYTLESNIPNIMKTGMSSNISYFTTTEYFNSNQAGDECGVRAHNINCVLKFRDDGRFRSDGFVQSAGRFNSGANQWSHPAKPKPIAKRKIYERHWTPLNY